MNCVVRNSTGETGTKPTVESGIPMPSGVFASTFTKAIPHIEHLALAQHCWDPNCDFEYPFILGVGPENVEEKIVSENVDKTICKLLI